MHRSSTSLEQLIQGSSGPSVVERGPYRDRILDHRGVMNMAKKRTKADKAQRQADELESKLDRRPAPAPKKTTTREDFSPAAAPIVREATKD
jgi:hypothetical protein